MAFHESDMEFIETVPVNILFLISDFGYRSAENKEQTRFFKLKEPKIQLSNIKIISGGKAAWRYYGMASKLLMLVRA